MVDYGMLDFLDQEDQPNLARSLRFSQRLSTPPQAEICQEKEHHKHVAAALLHGQIQPHLATHMLTMVWWYSAPDSFVL